MVGQLELLMLLDLTEAVAAVGQVRLDQMDHLLTLVMEEMAPPHLFLGHP